MPPGACAVARSATRRATRKSAKARRNRGMPRGRSGSIGRSATCARCASRRCRPRRRRSRAVRRPSSTARGAGGPATNPVANKPRRSGGLFIEDVTTETGVALLRQALLLAPAARVEVIERSQLDADELQAQLQRAAYLVLPALTDEPMPRALVEAFANAVPVIASRAGSAAELIEPGRNGLLFEPGSTRDLARELMWAEAFPEKVRQMGESARGDYRPRVICD